MNILRACLLFVGLILLPVSAFAVSGSVTTAAGGGPQKEFTLDAPVVADTLIFTGNGFLNCVFFEQNDAAPTAGSIIIYDNTAESGTVLLNQTFTTAVFTPFSLCPRVPFATGLYVGMTTTGDVNVSISRRP